MLRPGRGPHVAARNLVRTLDRSPSMWKTRTTRRPRGERAATHETRGWNHPSFAAIVCGGSDCKWGQQNNHVGGADHVGRARLSRKTGLYRFGGAAIRVKTIHTAVAENDPAALFTVVAWRPPLGPPEYMLGHRVA